MLATLRDSTESKHLVDLATKYLHGVKGSIVQEKKRREEAAQKTAAIARGEVVPAQMPPGAEHIGGRQAPAQMQAGGAAAAATSHKTWISVAPPQYPPRPGQGRVSNGAPTYSSNVERYLASPQQAVPAP